MADVSAVYMVGLLGMVSDVFGVYGSILGNPMAFNSRWQLLHSKLLIERARLETTIQRLSMMDADTSSGLDKVMVSLLSAMKKSLEKAAYLIQTTDPSGGGVRKTTGLVKFAFLGEDLNMALQETTEINDQLQLIVGILKERGNMQAQVNNQEGEPSTRQGPVLDEILASLGQLTGESAESLGQRLKATETQLPKDSKFHGPKTLPGGILRRLGTCCGLLLRYCGDIDPEFVEVSNCFQLWTHAVESEGLYEALDYATPDLRKIHRQSLGHLLLQSEVHIGQIIMWWRLEVDNASKKGEWRIAIEQCATAISTAREEFPGMPSFDPDDINAISDDPTKLGEVILETITLLIDNMINCLPSIVEFSRQHMALDGHIDPADVAQLLDISEALIEPASNALSEAANNAVGGDESKDGKKIDFESIQRVFEEQAKALEEWKAKHGQDIDTKLATTSPAKLASAQDAVSNIATILFELPNSIQAKVFQKEVGQTLESVMKTFEASVQSLVSLEQQLGSMEPPPSYSKVNRDRVLVDLAGNIHVSE